MFRFVRASRSWARFVAAAVIFMGVQAPDAHAANYSDIWWNPAESGWGLTIADHESQIFAVWYTYRADGRPIWYVIPGGALSSDRRTFSGQIYVTKGPPYSTAVFDPAQVSVTPVGTMSLDFAPPGLAAGVALFTYELAGVRQTKQIQRQPFGNAAPSWGHDFTDIYFNAAESGWGLTIANHGNDIFGVWYTYDTDREPLWVVMPGVNFNATGFSGALYTATGPYFATLPFDPARVVVTPAGSATVVLSDKNAPALKSIQAAWQPIFRGIAKNSLVVPQPFGNAGTLRPQVCTGTVAVTRTSSNCATAQFSGAISIEGVDWRQPGRQAAEIFIDEDTCFPSNGREIRGTNVQFIEESFVGAVDAAGTLVGTGTEVPLTYARNKNAAFDFRVPGGISVNGHFTYTKDADLFGTHVYTGSFACTPH